QRRFHVDGIEDVFDRHPFGLVLPDQPAELVKDRGKPVWKRDTGGQSDCTIMDAVQLLPKIDLHHPVAGAFRSAINAEDAHLSRVYRKAASGPHLLAECVGDWRYSKL